MDELTMTKTGHLEPDPHEDRVDEDDLTLEKNEINANQLPPKEVLDKLKDVIAFVKDRYDNHLQCLLLFDTHQQPFISIVSHNPDQFLIDRDAVTVNVIVDANFRISAKLVTLNRDVIFEVTADIEIDRISPVLEDLQRRRFQACVGFREKHFAEVLPLMQNSDFLKLSVSRFDGETIYRSKFCSFVVESYSQEQQCNECCKFYNDLPGSTLSEAGKLQGERRKRGRPKGSKNKSYEHTNSVSNNSTADLNVEIKSENIECEESVQQQEEESDDGSSTAMIDDSKGSEDFQVRRGLRKRITTSRQKALMALSKRKRGRPPTISGPFDCNSCDLKFMMLKDYRKHCLEHTNSFACDFENCDKRFKSAKELEIHTRKHRGEKPYVCHECDKAYQLRQDLRLHMRKHTDDRPFKCDYCPKSFARKQQVKNHIVVHTGDRAYLCFECGSSFGSPSTLTDHRKRRHLLVRNHPCATCSKAFYTKQELDAHFRTHTGDKPFQCTECGKKFSRPHHLRRHISSIHRAEKPRPSLAAQASFGDGKESINVDEDNQEDNQVLGLSSAFSGETVLVNAENLVSDIDDDEDIIETQFVVEGGSFARAEATSIGGSTTQLLLHKVTSSGNDVTGHPQAQYLLTHDDVIGGETGRTILLQQDSVSSMVDFSGSEGGYVLITTADNEQKLVPVAQIVSVMQQQEQTENQQDSVIP